jgi:hypothetical protein
MGTSVYPGALDDFAEASPPYLADEDTTGRDHPARHDDLEAAMEAVQGELGTDPAGGSATVKARLDGVDTSLAGKADTSALASKADIASPTFTGTPAAPTASVGTDTTQLATTGYVYDVAPLMSNRNLLYNGAMQVAQRGTSTAGITSGGYWGADRWQFGLTLGTWTQTLENDAPAGSGFRKSLKILCTTADASPAAGDLAQFGQLLEGQDLQRIAKGTASAQQVTLSFWVKSNVTGTYVAYLFDADNSRMANAQYSISALATWERKTITFPADLTGVFDNDNNNSLGVRFGLAAGTDWTSGSLQSTWASLTNANLFVGQTNLAAATSNYWQVTGVQLEVGPTATGFEFKSYGQELAECQRYYYVHVDGDLQAIALGTYYSANNYYANVFFPTSMRTAPSLVVASGTAYYYIFYNSASDAVDGFTIQRPGVNSAELNNTTEAAGTAYAVGFARTTNASAKIAFSAEL